MAEIGFRAAWEISRPGAPCARALEREGTPSSGRQCRRGDRRRPPFRENWLKQANWRRRSNREMRHLVPYAMRGMATPPELQRNRSTYRKRTAQKRSIFETEQLVINTVWARA